MAAPESVAALIEAMRPVLGAAPAGPLGVAVSGGSDSTALLLLCHLHAQSTGRSVHAVTVDHGLRPESAAEAAAVARLCAARGIEHTILRWQRAGSKGNLQAAARAARRALISDWAAGRDIRAVSLGHTQDDQAETVLMRLARGSGVDGLAGMAAVSGGEAMLWLRPLLGLRRAALRHWLAGQQTGWLDDPSNEDPAYDRVRARRALEALAPLGLGVERLAATAERMGNARAALEAQAMQVVAQSARTGPAGDIVLAPGPLIAAPREIGLRVLAWATMWVSGAAYRPRFARLQAVYASIAGDGPGRGTTLHGCVLRTVRGGIAVRREPGRVAPAVPAALRDWDGRWRLASGPTEALVIAAAGDAALAARPGWRDLAIPREALATVPALWHADGRLAALPLLDGCSLWRFERIASVPGPLPWPDAGALTDT